MLSTPFARGDRTEFMIGAWMMESQRDQSFGPSKR